MRRSWAAGKVRTRRGIKYWTLWSEQGSNVGDFAGMRAAVTSQFAGRLGNNPVMRKMYGANVPPAPQQGETPVNDKTGRVIGYTRDGKTMRPI
jgi:hypothetical protein